MGKVSLSVVDSRESWTCFLHKSLAGSMENTGLSRSIGNTLIYGTAKNNYISNCSTSIRMY